MMCRVNERQMMVNEQRDLRFEIWDLIFHWRIHAVCLLKTQFHRLLQSKRKICRYLTVKWNFHSIVSWSNFTCGLLLRMQHYGSSVTCIVFLLPFGRQLEIMCGEWFILLSSILSFWNISPRLSFEEGDFSFIILFSAESFYGYAV